MYHICLKHYNVKCMYMLKKIDRTTGKNENSENLTRFLSLCEYLSRCETGKHSLHHNFWISRRFKYILRIFVYNSSKRWTHAILLNLVNLICLFLYTKSFPSANYIKKEVYIFKLFLSSLESSISHYGL